MADLIVSGLDWLDQKRREHLSTAVTYRRGAVEAAVLATFATTFYEVVDDNGAAVKAQSSDFIISTADLSDFGEPALGDEIVAVLGGVETSFEVRQLAGENHFRPHDATGKAYRIHTKQTGPCAP